MSPDDEVLGLEGKGKIFNPTPEQKQRRRKILMWVGIGVLVVGAVAGLVAVVF